MHWNMFLESGDIFISIIFFTVNILSNHNVDIECHQAHRIIIYNKIICNGNIFATVAILIFKHLSAPVYCVVIDRNFFSF